MTVENFDPFCTILYLEVVIILIYCGSGHAQIPGWAVVHDCQHRCGFLILHIGAPRPMHYASPWDQL